MGFATVLFADTPPPDSNDSLLVGAILWWWIVGFLIKAPLTFAAIRSLSDHFRIAISAEAIPHVTLQ